ncbi:hypothetical protein DERP_012416 [Dermatophagoides pteronyssinus]|uniref:Uncharacterized protein n=1 Tax=Dermatophagoides pteronyssinus TaxID=6956 RepID=A0ABQ8IUQ4_DERPT|nr:hypothetical protein DERP_012416 [Dermatophagoides pteronyssinus]
MSERLMFIGYTNKIGCYRLLNPETSDIIISNNVQKMYYERFDSEGNLSEVTSSSNFDLMEADQLKKCQTPYGLMGLEKLYIFIFTECYNKVLIACSAFVELSSFPFVNFN